MILDGLHHITMITGDARQNVAFYAELLGLRLVKKTVNFDSPGAYHLYFGDEAGTPRTLLTWFEFPGAGEIHTLELGVAREAALDFWAELLRAHGYPNGTVHHIAWGSADEDHLAWQERVRAAGHDPTGVRDRDYFRSIYFREPRGILFEIATRSPGFAVDEDPEHLGEELRVPSMHAHLRERLERMLTPIENPRRAKEPA